MTTEQFLKPRNQLHISITVPEIFSSLHITIHEAKIALGNLLEQNPQIWIQAFESLKKTPANTSQLPQISKEQRETVLSSLREFSDEDLDDDMDSETLIQSIKSSRRNKENSHNFFDE